MFGIVTVKKLFLQIWNIKYIDLPIEVLQCNYYLSPTKKKFGGLQIKKIKNCTL